MAEDLRTSASAGAPRYARACDAFAFVCLYGQGVAALVLLPDSAWSHFTDPAYLAIASAGIVVALITILRIHGLRWSRAEQILLAMFLSGMPLVYLASGVQSGQLSGLPVEFLGLALFATLAVLGLRYSPWFTVGGIFAHGLLWDTWHYQPATMVPAWYAAACAIVDVGFGLYAMIQIMLSRARHERPSSR
ncbi:hypothetical protein [Pendulispora albinea]|uniref:Integral membrane protein n=1 Tax=Pendulispora albinea TaxID=2741071 RepID=A0ABZ2M543_9BACT